jgi:hypothetical protein
VLLLGQSGDQTYSLSRISGSPRFVVYRLDTETPGMRHQVLTNQVLTDCGLVPEIGTKTPYIIHRTMSTVMVWSLVEQRLIAELECGLNDYCTFNYPYLVSSYHDRDIIGLRVLDAMTNLKTFHFLETESPVKSLSSYGHGSLVIEQRDTTIINYYIATQVETPIVNSEVSLIVLLSVDMLVTDRTTYTSAVNHGKLFPVPLDDPYVIEVASRDLVAISDRNLVYIFSLSELEHRSTADAGDAINTFCYCQDTDRFIVHRVDGVVVAIG